MKEDPKYDIGEIVDVVIERKTNSKSKEEVVIETQLDGRVNDRSFEEGRWKYEIEFFYDKPNSWFEEEDLSLL